MIKKLNVLILVVALSVTAIQAKVWVISDSTLMVQFNDETALLKITDKRCNKTWGQTELNENLKVATTVQDGNTLHVVFTGDYPLEVDFSLIGSSSLQVELKAEKEVVLEKLSYPAAFATPGKDHYLVFTDGEGFLLHADDAEYGIGRQIMHSMRGLSMPWMGVTDSAFKTGYSVVVDTPDDCEIWVKRYNGLISFEPLWISQKGHFGYNRKLIYNFFDEGGYVAQCKKYRQYVWSKLPVPPTLREKQKRFPALEKMAGAVHVYVWDDAREVEFAREMKESGIEKAFILWNPNHPPYPEAGYDNRLKELGYLSGVYELLRDVHLRDTTGHIDPSNRSGTWLNRFRYPGLFHKIALQEKGGKLHHSGFGYDINPKTILPLISEIRTDREMDVYPHESFFLDGFLASGIFEDYGDENPLTRTGYKEAVIEMNKYFEDRYNSIVGVEWGADYGVPTAAYAHGMTTLHHMLYPSPHRNRKNSIHYVGEWDNPSRPSIMVGEYVADEHYHKWAINEQIRVPLYQLVYHDAIATTWRWDDASHHMPEIWWKKDLFDILYGTTPLWSIDRQRWEKFKNTFIDSYKNVCPWLGEIAWDELLHHRFVSDDHKVQESVFSSGRKVVVNFGDTDYRYEGKVIPPRSSLKIRQ